MGAYYDTGVTVTCPSGVVCQTKAYDAYVADALGDEALIKMGEAWDKASVGIIASYGGDQPPSWEHEYKRAKAWIRKIPLADLNHIMFMAVATYRKGELECMVPTGQGQFPAKIRLLDDDGKPMPEFAPTDYPHGGEKVIEWSQPVPAEFREQYSQWPETINCAMNIMTGDNRADMEKMGMVNLNTDLKQRKPRYYDPDSEQMRPYSPAERPPSWLSEAIAEKAREVDPLTQYIVKVQTPNGLAGIPLWQVPDFLFLGFI